MLAGALGSLLTLLFSPFKEFDRCVCFDFPAPHLHQIRCCFRQVRHEACCSGHGQPLAQCWQELSTELTRNKAELSAQNALLSATTDHPPPSGETPNLHQGRPGDPNRTRAGSPPLEARAVHSFSLIRSSAGIVQAFRWYLETALEARLEDTQNRCRNRCVDQNHGAATIACGALNASGENCSNWAFTSPNARSRNT